MPIDETVLDPPVTPAPVFAYRALKGVFFGSPESSPENVYHNNKENITPVLSLSPSPSKRKLALDAALHLTPSTKRTKRDSGGAILSPTKGILRTPGLATPRTKALRDVNVKFKSVSPEEVAQRRNHRLKMEGPRQVDKDKKEETQAPAVKNDNASLNNGGLVCASTTNTAGTAAVSTFTPCAIEAYIAQTEKEMKKLVKYGQKMREYARKKDAENLELKGMIEVLKRENERLRRSSDVGLGQTHQQTENKQKQQQHHHHSESDTNGHGGQRVESVAEDKAKRAQGYVREEVGRVEARSQSVRLHSHQSLAHRRKEEPPRVGTGTGTGTGTTGSMSTQRRTTRSVSSSSTKRHQVVQGTTVHDEFGRPSTIASSLAPAPVPAPAKMDEGGNEHRTSLPLRSPSGSMAIRGTKGTFDREIGTGSTRLPPDRLAAARERLRRRAEAKKASAEMNAGDHDQSHVKAHGQREGVLIDNGEDDVGPPQLPRPASFGPGRRESHEQSLVDWVNL
ncbi:hypothetical protein PV08_01230 [Exophiala spinifera]|uniref:Spindle pole body-associated protein cut12 domain-containing protein n=1 Tax=Exophiala spinifera TaxID=91928 RepID=A0A0D2BP14_9EURO|nr:uncharacterized protein PV08_01230 [Exophiala spinifera]KIW20653.1 hypothetical protein PV08_01230 [Exophiala spinifera]